VNIGPLAVLRDANLTAFVVSRFLAGVAMTLLRATFAWQIYALTGSAFYLGLIGLIQFIPTLALSLVAGAVADSFDRRRIMMISLTTTLCGSVALFWLTSHALVNLPILYGLVVLASAAMAFEGPARASLLPTLVPREQFPSAVVVNSAAQNISWMTGPVLMGFIIAHGGVAAAYVAHVCIIVLAIASLAVVHAGAVASERRAVTLQAIREGVSFVISRQAIVGAMTLDMFAVIFAGATALLPIYATEILQVGPTGYGLLASALELGTVLMSLIFLALPPITRPGRALLAAVSVFGIATIVFGFSRWFPLSLVAFVIAGMADQVSMVTRQMIIQLTTPDALRGRVSSVNLLFIGASNQLGAAESGFIAALTSPTFAVVSGGVGCLAVLALVAVTLPELRRYRLGQ
jgi:MFS family permease